MSKATDENEDGLSEIAVQVQIQDKSHAVPGLTHKSCPGLAVTMYPFGCFAVTHINSGLRVCDAYQRVSSALLTMSQFALVAAMKNKSWSELDQEAAFNLIRDAGPDEVPFDGCTVTSNAGTRKMTVSEWFQIVRLPIMDEFPWEESDPFEGAIQNFEKMI
ncbi:hypothetical protein [uncultured Marinobacter sp.]|uniref:hypothetical protein n=1 Tax=uncultured Marinobacter sp. TaxID=187379 RepID=UPI0030D727E0